MASQVLITTQSLPVTHFLSPVRLERNLWAHRDLIRQLTWRNVLSRYRGSALGLVWSFLIPVMMLLVYSFVFGVVFKARWPRTPDDSKVSFVLTLYAGLLVYTLFAETLSAAPALIVGNPNYVKKVVFPLEILPVCSLGAALIHFVVGIVALLLCSLLVAQRVSPTLWLFPVVVLPLLLMTLGAAWFLASLGVYLRDVSQFIGVALQMLIYLSPVFYALEQVPVGLRTFMLLNPLTPIVQHARDTLLWGVVPDWRSLGLVLIFSLLILQLGYVWFMKTRRGFADVL
jgi:lipopolysaccharide transport system permease protein